VTPPISTVFLYLLILLMLVGGARFGYRFLRLYATRHHLLGRGEHIESRVMIIGAGSAGGNPVVRSGASHGKHMAAS